MTLLENVGFVHHGAPVQLEGRMTGENAHQPYEIRHTLHERWKPSVRDHGAPTWEVVDEHRADFPVGKLFRDKPAYATDVSSTISR